MVHSWCGTVFHFYKYFLKFVLVRVFVDISLVFNWNVLNLREKRSGKSKSNILYLLFLIFFPTTYYCVGKKITKKSFFYLESVMFYSIFTNLTYFEIASRYEILEAPQLICKSWYCATEANLTYRTTYNYVCYRVAYEHAYLIFVDEVRIHTK